MCEFINCPVCEGEADNMQEVECPDCRGEKTFHSDCCAEPIVFHDRCSSCRDNCGSEEEVCPKCEGKGTILIDC